MTQHIEDRPRGLRVRPPQAIRVTAPGRLHIGFLDLNGSLGRRFGSLGIAVESPVTRVLIETADALTASGPDAERALDAVRRYGQSVGRFDDRLHVTVEEALPPHSGLGSGTQIGLAVAVGASALNGRQASAEEAARALGRGARSSIGLHAFQGGGILLDGGQPVGSKSHDAPPLLSRVPVPPSWRILLIFDQARTGLSGAQEKQAMAGLPEFPETLADRLCRLVLMAALPAAMEGDADGFGRAVGEIQRRLGDHFAQFQGGRFTSPDVAEVLAFVEASGVPGVGQSSWGPTGFAVFGDSEAAEQAASDLRSRFADRPNLIFDVVRGNNHGAIVEDVAHSSARSSGETAERRH
jgi:beta-RFAP synthase